MYVKNKFVAVMLVLILFISMLPIGVFAEDVSIEDVVDQKLEEELTRVQALADAKAAAIAELETAGITRDYYFNLIKKANTVEGVETLKVSIIEAKIKSDQEAEQKKDQATAATVNATRTQKQADVDYARTLVNALLGEQELKSHLNTLLDDIQALIDKKVLEIEKELIIKEFKAKNILEEGHITLIQNAKTIEDLNAIKKLILANAQKDKEEIDKLNKSEHFQYLYGYPDNTVRPNATITRGEAAAIFFRLLNDDYRDNIRTDKHNFSDVSSDLWSRKHIASLSGQGILTGYADGTFRPERPITRAELITIAAKFESLETDTNSKFTDVDGHWADKYINSASAKGWVAGFADKTFRPDQLITRAEFVTIVNNVLGRNVKKENILPGTKQFIDLSSNQWFYAAMQEAINSHKYTRKENSIYEVWTEIYYPKLEN